MAWNLLNHTSVVGFNSVTTPAIDTTGANFIVIFIEQYFGTAAGSVSDSNGNVYNALTAYNSTVDVRAQLLYLYAPIVGAGHTFTYSGASKQGGISVQAWSGSAVVPFDVQNGAGSNVATSSLATGSVSPNSNNELIVTGIGLNADGGSPFSIDTGFTITDQTAPSIGTNFGTGMAYLVQTAATSINPTWSWGGTKTTSAAAIATFIPFVPPLFTLMPRSVM